MIRSVRNSQRLGRESFLIPTYVFQSTKSSFYHIKRITLEFESWIPYSFLSRYVLLDVGLEKWSKDLEFENFDGILSLLDFKFVARVPLRLPSFFPSQLVLLMVVQGKEYMKLDVGKVVDHNT